MRFGWLQIAHREGYREGSKEGFGDYLRHGIKDSSGTPLQYLRIIFLQCLAVRAHVKTAISLAASYEVLRGQVYSQHWQNAHIKLAF